MNDEVRLPMKNELLDYLKTYKDLYVGWIDGYLSELTPKTSLQELKITPDDIIKDVETETFIGLGWYRILTENWNKLPRE
ncbi:MAG: hypothetical protein KAS32_19250 [Candidatus Peribacteraceae bacterium]|nr:hypothetical protein [Candidatus Peribacteraceae bacterium]